MAGDKAVHLDVVIKFQPGNRAPQALFKRDIRVPSQLTGGQGSIQHTYGNIECPALSMSFYNLAFENPLKGRHDFDQTVAMPGACS